jgi:hypothetical protein
VKRAAALGILAIMLLATRQASAQCDAATAEARTVEIEAVLARDARNARRWDLGWAATFGVLAGAQLGMAVAEWAPLQDFDDKVEASLYVGAIKSGIGSVSHLVLPLRVARPGPRSGDACADLAAAERALQESAKKERETFYLNHLGSLALNVGGLLYLGLHDDAWKEGVMSFALGYPVGLLSTYTQPRRAWHLGRRAPTIAAWNLGAVRRSGYTGLQLSLSF